MAGKKKKNAKQKKERSFTPRKSSSEQLKFAEVEKWEIPPILTNSVEVGSLPSPIWTETKAQLIANYLRLFLMITRHGIYIDGFAGPQDKQNPNSWAAKLVVELSPPWMKWFFLCELDKRSYSDLTQMLGAQPTVRGRQIDHKRGDFNRWVDDVLASGTITDRRATFALLDQRSTECHWSTVQKLAAHKRGARKIELFYFFPTGWVHRAISETKDKSVLTRWWGDDGWKQVENIKQGQAQASLSKEFSLWGTRTSRAGRSAPGNSGPATRCII